MKCNPNVKQKNLGENLKRGKGEGHPQQKERKTAAAQSQGNNTHLSL